MTQVSREAASAAGQYGQGSPADTLRQRWLALLDQQPGLRIRNAAELLGVSEAELLATDCGDSVTRLQLEPYDLLGELHRCGRLMALARNDGAVHETLGPFGELKGKGNIRLFLGAQDQRLFAHHWTRAFAVQSDKRESVQFFNAHGRASFKLFTTPDTDLDAWQELVSRFVAADQSPLEQDIRAEEPKRYRATLNRDEISDLQQRWDAITDVHQFHGLLKDFDLRRLTAFENAGPERAWAIQSEAVERLIQLAGERQLPLMIFVGNGDVVQIHTGTPGRLLRTGPWFNILDPDFNLHLNTETIQSAWVVRRPTRDGVVTAVEAFDRHGESIVQFFGERHEGEPESLQWRALAEEMPHAAK